MSIDSFGMSWDCPVEVPMPADLETECDTLQTPH